MRTLFVAIFLWAIATRATYAVVYVRTSASTFKNYSLCDQAAEQVAIFYGVPERILHAIALVETGIYHPQFMSHPDRTRRPWPWTLQVSGKGYYFATKQEAVKAARVLWNQGIRNFDVGCMQINMLHHANAFMRHLNDAHPDMNAAFTPMLNVRYAATYLIEKERSTGSWEEAIAAYHSQTPEHGQSYKARVQRAMMH